MSTIKTKASLEQQLKEFILRDFTPHFGRLVDKFAEQARWMRLLGLGTRLWLDSGNIDEIERYWTKEFSAVTVNNTLLSKEIQAGRYDSLVPEIGKILGSYAGLSEQEIKLEIYFILNAWHGLRLVEKFGGYVSLEEHTDIADDVEKAVSYAKRLYEICPERFYIKIPFTAAGLLATRKLSAEGIAVNHTLGFSARQNYLIARIGRPAYVNVFLGRLNSFIADNKLGDGSYIGERATLASQKAVRKLCEKNLTDSLQIGASFRSGRQVLDLAGIDVMTMPPKVAGEFLGLDIKKEQLYDRTSTDYSVGFDEQLDPESVRLNTLWDVDEKLVSCVEALEKENLDSFTPDDLYDFFREHDCADVLVRWGESQIETSYEEGKIPKLANWKDVLESKEAGLDSLMNLAGLNSFRRDQDAMDERVKNLLNRGRK